MIANSYKYLCSIYFLCLMSALLSLCFLNANLAQAQGQQSELDTLDAAAKQAYKEGDFTQALEKYAQLEGKLAAHHMAQRQVNLLHNQAIIFLELQQYGQAAARLQQIQVIQPSPQNDKLLRETRNIIEYKAYQKHPNTAFIRGNTNDFTLWLHAHQLGLRPLTIATLVSWTLFLASLLSLYYLRKNKRWTWIAKISTGLLAVLFVVIFSQFAIYKLTDDYSFGVVTSTDGIRLEPRMGAKPLNNPADLSGLVVRILIQNGQWTLAERSDKKTAWIPKQDLYILSPAE